ncbi:exodeoxyribonuclease VII small subunit [Aliidiomarina iranensis]|uniref:Exodeoxyribonuclease 7 small subunit n=1 Tax=Aliidiomarina iranensis TaxID=1434071 RepID=A0A432VV82_9GAMM|nr:exodeoxyribonuclease VII small subunit [Aliidiomarina iranensis]RUO20447.1 exodeoxyribonuclease VII small subunit [Aliidiomarina iranensis]
MSSEKNSESLGFEQAMAELEQIVSALEEGELPLEESLKQFERAVFLSRISQQKLQQAEQKVQILMQQNGSEELNPFSETPTSHD